MLRRTQELSVISILAVSAALYGCSGGGGEGATSGGAGTAPRGYTGPTYH